MTTFSIRFRGGLTLAPTHLTDSPAHLPTYSPAHLCTHSAIHFSTRSYCSQFEEAVLANGGADPLTTWKKWGSLSRSHMHMHAHLQATRYTVTFPPLPFDSPLIAVCGRRTLTRLPTTHRCDMLLEHRLEAKLRQLAAAVREQATDQAQGPWHGLRGRDARRLPEATGSPQSRDGTPRRVLDRSSRRVGPQGSIVEVRIDSTLFHCMRALVAQCTLNGLRAHHLLDLTRCFSFGDVGTTTFQRSWTLPTKFAFRFKPMCCETGNETDPLGEEEIL
jgi:hypothetical protein